MVYMQYADWEGRYNAEAKEDKAFVVTDRVALKKKSLKPTENGIFSEQFGVQIDTDTDIKEYSCECGNLIGRFYEGEICEKCNSEVQLTFGSDIRRVGWVDLGDYKIMTPAGYEMVKKVVGPKALNEILEFVVDTNIDGHLTLIDDRPANRRSNPYYNIGFKEFYKRFEEILTYFAAAKNRYEHATLAIKNKLRIFSSKIPIYSVLLRPVFTSPRRNSVSTANANTCYMEIVAAAKRLNSTRRHDYRKNNILYFIQTQLMELYDLVIRKELSSKKGLIRLKILGQRLAFSSRMVIISGRKTVDNIDIDSVCVPFKSFITLYELELFNMLKRGIPSSHTGTWTDFQIHDYIRRAKYSDDTDDLLYEASIKLVNERKGGLWVLVNRNPTFDLGSTQCMKIGSIYKNPKVYTLGVPRSSLALWTGDYDGDVLNVYSMKEKCVVEAFKKALRSSILIINRSGGVNYLNPNLHITKDRIVSLLSFLGDYEHKPKDFGLDEESVKAYLASLQEMDNYAFPEDKYDKDGFQEPHPERERFEFSTGSKT